MAKENIQPYERASHKLRPHEIMLNNFIGGIFWALGATVGLSLIIALLTLVSHSIDVVPFVGTFVSHIIDFILTHNPNLNK